ncbi:MAG TPA: YfhO family protein [Gemmataceae bacterium]|jgi:hypothetical protein
MFSQETLANGDAGMWNPNILCGIDFTASPHNHMRCPLDWPLFLLPAHYFLHGLTIQVFLLVFLCGPLSYLFFREEFVVLGLGLVYLLATLSRRPDLRPLFCPCLCTLLLIDLIPFNKNYSRQITEAFARPDALYPDRSDLFAQGARRTRQAGTAEGIDTPTYRVNHPHMALRLSAEEMDTNLPCVYGVRMYGGLNSDVPRGLATLVWKFQPSVRVSSSISSQLTHPKLLDLLGCGYDVDDAGRLVERPTALSRFMLFHNFEVVDSQRVLDRLAEDSFVASERLLVEADPGLDASWAGMPAEVVSYDSLATSELRVACATPTPALLFFGDSYHPDWRAYVDGRRQPMLRADGNFMAVAIPAGKSEVRFRFRPHMFIRGLVISGLGAAGFLAVLVWATLRRSRRPVQPALSLSGLRRTAAASRVGRLYQPASQQAIPAD